MDYEALTKKVEVDVEEYLQDAGNTQQAIQEARTELRHYRLGRTAVTEWEHQQVATIHAADKLLRKKLSATLGENSVTKKRRGTHHAVFTAIYED